IVRPLARRRWRRAVVCLAPPPRQHHLDRRGAQPGAHRAVCARRVHVLARAMTVSLRERVPLAPYTTLGLGGPARYFLECRTVAELREALTAARARGLRVQIIGGGPKLVVAAAGLPGLGPKDPIGGVPPRDTAAGVAGV